ncbi:putative quinol monooxygenase [Flexibacterium corallicola]|uniref:putative quinol monooxygenase n=1 Tax=Flexibacterium corallicola TaxID=3037259 RepID=UPI00286F4C0C|nr:antibiotic biosynthesis monooxygenase [Pseudovibrio sp. M1P-2-3]
MITRIYRVRIKPELREEFEPLFQTVALSSVAERAGCLRAILGGPSPLSPDEYAMISEWDSEDSLREFAGQDWSQAHIPEGMEKFVEECWVHHYIHM